MKLATFVIKSSGQRTVGVFDGEHYLDAVVLSNGAVPNNMIAVLEGGDEMLNQIRSAIAGTGNGAHRYRPDEVELMLPREVQDLFGLRVDLLAFRIKKELFSFR